MKKSLLFALLLALFMPWAANAQNRTLVTIGDGTSTQSYPLPGFYGYQYDVFLYTPSAAQELGVDSEISSLAFDVATNNSNTGAEMYIWVKDVAPDYALATATTFNEYITDATQVYANDEFTSTLGWNTFSFESTFSHEGGKALLVAIRGVGCSTGGGCSRSCRYTTASNTWWGKHVDTSDPGQEVSGNLSGNRANIQLDLTYTGAVCFTPSGLTYTNVVENAATLSWNENGSSTAWVLEYSTASDYAGATTVNVSGTPTTSLSGLSALTTYYVRVKADCGSDWLTGSFTTTAHAETVGNAWADDFEGTDFGWELINGTITNAWAWGTATNNGGTHAIYISNNGGTTNAYNNGSPAMVYATKLLNFADGKYEFTYDWNGNGESTYDYLRVALVPATVILTAGTNTPSYFNYSSLPSGWIALDGGSKLNQVTAWQNMSATVNVTAGNYYMVLAWRNDGTSGTNPPAAVDNVSINRVACPYDVTGLAVSEITTSSATLSWEGGEATQWQVAYSTASNFEGAAEEIVNSASYNMSGLQSSSTYFVKVRAYCGGEDFGAWSNVFAFATACDAMDLSNVDFSENFDGITLASSYAPSTRTLPICWNYINTSTYVSNSVYPTMYYYSSTDYSHSTPNCLRFYSTYSSSTSYDPQDEYAILPAMENLAGKQITLWIRGYNATTPFKVGMITDPTDASTFVEITNDANPSLSTSYQEFTYIIPADATANHVAIMMEAAISGNSTRGLYIDDIKIADAPTCAKPTELTVTGVGTTTVTIGWTNGADDQTSWQICLNGDETNLIMINSNPFTIEGLSVATAYTAKVRAYCNEDDQSEWSNEVSFATACEAITITEDNTYSEGFEAYTGVAYNSNGVVPTCWDSYSTGPVTPHIISGTGSYVYLHEGTNALTFYGSGNCYAALPEFTNALSELEIKFWMQTESATNGSLTLGYITSEDEDYSTFTEIETYENNSGSMVQRTTDLNEVPTTATRLVFRWSYENQWSCCIDDVEVTLIPTCTKPTALECTATTTTTATLSWTAGADETAWQICLNGDETNLIMAESNPFTVEDLTASTAYTAKVRAYCSADDQSDWSTEVSFATACEAITTFPWMVDFESFNNNTVPNCWDNSASTTSTVSSNPERVWGVYSYEENQMMRMYNYFVQDGSALINTPDLVLPADAEYHLTFDYSHRASCGTFTVKISTDGGTTFTDLQSYTTTNNDYNYNVPGTFTSAEPISLADYAGQTVILQFYAVADYSSGAIFVDNVRVGEPGYTLEIEGYENDDDNDGYYLIASPVTVDLTNHAMTTDDFDLYYFDQAQDLEWINYKGADGNFNLEPGKGYLYAKKATTEGEVFEFTLTGTAYNGDGTIELVYDDNAIDFKGWNLVGNPWGVKAYPDHAFYTMAEGGASIDVTPNDANTEVAPMTGIFVVAEAANETVTFSTENPNGKSANLALNITNSSKLVDRAIVRFGEGRQLPKFQLNPNHTKVYIEQNNKDYAIVNAEEIGEMPVSFKAEKNGNYTISFSNENVEFGYLHLIDNMTGADIDLLETPSYSFDAKVTDYASRFKLVFATSNNSNDDSFACYYNGNIIVSNEGNATLNIVDVLGRTISSQNINGSENVRINAKAGVYMLQLIQGENVKTQKIVVE